MNFSSVMSVISGAMMKVSSIFSAGDLSFIAASTTSADQSVVTIVSFLAKIFYFICKWMLYVLDILFSYVAELSGLNMSFESLDTLISPESDMVFNMLISGKEMITPIIRALIGLTIVIIIVFSIIALVKNQFNAVEKNDLNANKKVFIKLGKSLALLLILPMTAILGIIASDLILQTLYQATNPGGSISLSTQIFSTSATSANAYRIYGTTGQRIPITYDFTKEKEILEYYKDKSVTDTFSEYLQSTSNLIYTTYLMFNDDNYQSFDSLNTQLHTSNDTVKGNADAFYKVYDVSLSAANSDDVVSKYKRIESYQAEYLTMADLLDYCVNTSTKVYFKTIEEVLNSYTLLTDNAGINTKFNSFVSMRGITFCDESGTVINDGRTALQIYESDDWSIIRYTSDYFSPSETGEPAFKTQIQYNHVRGATDEREGAKFIVAIEKETIIDGVSMTYYDPFLKGYSQAGKGREFSTDFIKDGQIISAKGLFCDAKYPTAIKLAADNSTVVFYREKISQVTVGKSGDLGSLQMIPDGSGGFFSKVKTFFKTLFNPQSMIPDLNFNERALDVAYDSEFVTINELPNGMFHVSYMFADTLTDAIGSIYGLNLNNLYAPYKINYLILVMGTLILIKVTFKAVFSLISRAFDLFLVIVAYPTACASMPLDDGAWKQWLRTYMARLFSTYGLLLGINFVLLLFPIISSIQFFTPEEVGSTKIIKRVGGIFFSLLSVNQITAMLNLVVAILFQLVAFTMIQTIPGIIGSIMGFDKNTADPLEPAVNTIKIIGNAGRMIADFSGGLMGILKVVTNKSYRQEKLKKLGDKAKGFVPGSAVVGAGLDKIHLMKKGYEQHKAQRDLNLALSSGSSTKEDIEKKFEKLEKAREAYTKSIKDPTSARKAEDDKRKEARRTGVSSRSKFDDELNNVDYGDKTGRAMRHEKRKAKKFLKRLKAKEKKSGLTAEEQEAKSIYEQKLSNIKEEKGNRKDQKSEYKQKLKEIDDFKRRIAAGDRLTAEESNRYLELTKEVKEYNDNKRTLKKRNRAQNKRIKKDKKARVKRAKIQSKQKAKREKLEGIFKQTGGRFRRKQKRIMNGKKRMFGLWKTKGLNDHLMDISTKISKSGVTQNVSQMKIQEINQLIAEKDKNGLTDEQVSLLEEYTQLRTQIDTLNQINKTEYEKKAEVDVRARQLKDQQIAGKFLGGIRLGNVIRRGIITKRRNKTTTAQKRAQIDNINEQIKNLEENGIDGSTYKQYQNLLRKKAELTTKLETQESWQSMNTKAGRKDALHANWKRELDLKKGLEFYEEARLQLQEELQERLDKAKNDAERAKINKEITTDMINERAEQLEEESKKKKWWQRR